MTRLLKFSPPCKDNLQGCISVKGIKDWLLMFFLLIFIFFKKMHSQNDEIGVLEVREIKIFFAAQHNHVEKTFTEFFENSLHGL